MPAPVSRWWGNGDYRNLAGGGRNAVEWQGELLSAHLGTDVRSNQDLLVGLALSWSRGTFDYTDHTDGEAMSGRYASSRFRLTRTWASAARRGAACGA